MKIRKTSDQVSPLLDAIIQTFEKERHNILKDLGEKFLELTLSNFGANGENRSTPWKSLSKKYAKKVGRSYATLDRTGALKESIKLKITSEYAIISTSNKYAAAQAFGYRPRNLPARNFWPIQNYGSPSYGTLVPNANEQMFNTLNKSININSYGALPLLSRPSSEVVVVYGNPFN